MENANDKQANSNIINLGRGSIRYFGAWNSTTAPLDFEEWSKQNDEMQSAYAAKAARDKITEGIIGEHAIRAGFRFIADDNWWMVRGPNGRIMSRGMSNSYYYNGIIAMGRDATDDEAIAIAESWATA